MSPKPRNLTHLTLATLMLAGSLTSAPLLGRQAEATSVDARIDSAAWMKPDPAMDKFIAKCQKDGSFIDGAGLQPTKAATRVRLSKGKITSTDGPFTEAKEVVGGFSIMEFKTREEALANAREFMQLHKEHWPEFEGECEVRPFEAGPN